MMRSFGATHPGLRRENNQDAFVLLDHLSAAILADGMGGQNCGDELRTQLGFSEDRLLTVPNRKILTMAVGTFDHILIRTHVQTIEPGDRILLCSDGLYGPVDDATTAEILTRGGTLQAQTGT